MGKIGVFIIFYMYVLISWHPSWINVMIVSEWVCAFFVISVFRTNSGTNMKTKLSPKWTKHFSLSLDEDETIDWGIEIHVHNFTVPKNQIPNKSNTRAPTRAQHRREKDRVKKSAHHHYQFWLWAEHTSSGSTNEHFVPNKYGICGNTSQCFSHNTKHFTLANP